MTEKLQFADITQFVGQLSAYRPSPADIRFVIPTEEQYALAILAGYDPDFLIKGWELSSGARLKFDIIASYLSSRDPSTSGEL